MTSSTQHQRPEVVCLCRPGAARTLRRCSALLKHWRLAVPSSWHRLFRAAQWREKFERICCFTAHVSPHAFCSCQRIWRQLKEQGRSRTSSRAAFHAAHSLFFFFFFFFSHVFAPGLLFTWRRRLPKQQMFADAFRRARNDSGGLPSCAPDSHRFRQNVGALLWSVKPRECSRPCFSCRKPSANQSCVAERLQLLLFFFFFFRFFSAAPL